MSSEEVGKRKNADTKTDTKEEKRLKLMNSVCGMRRQMSLFQEKLKSIECHVKEMSENLNIFNEELEHFIMDIMTNMKGGKDEIKGEDEIKGDDERRGGKKEENALEKIVVQRVHFRHNNNIVYETLIILRFYVLLLLLM